MIYFYRNCIVARALLFHNRRLFRTNLFLITSIQIVKFSALRTKEKNGVGLGPNSCTKKNSFYKHPGFGMATNESMSGLKAAVYSLSEYRHKR